jgi:hypothetical protein
MVGPKGNGTRSGNPVRRAQAKALATEEATAQDATNAALRAELLAAVPDDLLAVHADVAGRHGR